MRSHLLLFLLLFTGPFMFAQQYAFEVYSVHQGLIQSEANYITQDHENYMWVATSGGLSKFDGTYFDNYSLQEGLSDKLINTLYVDRSNRLWIGTYQGGVCYFNENHVSTLELKELEGKTVYFINQDEKGKVLFGTSAGLFVYDRTTILPARMDGGSHSNEFTHILKKKDGTILVSNSASEIYEYKDQKLHRVNSFGPQGVYDMAEMPGGEVYLATYSGCRRMKDGKLLYNGSHAESWAECVFTDDRKRIWVAYPGHGVALIEGKRVTMLNQSNGLPSNTIHHIYQDKEGNIWFATYGKGICKFGGEAVIRYGQKDGLQDENIIGIYNSNEGELLLSTLNRGLYEIKDRQVKDAFSKKCNENAAVWKVFRANDGRVFHATNLGLLEKKGGHCVLVEGQKPSDVFYDVCTDLNDNLWAASEFGLYKFGDEGMRFYDSHSFFIKKGCRILYVSHDNEVFIGTFGGGAYKMEEGVPIPIDKNKKLMHAFITSIKEDSESNIWIGTNGNGLIQYNPKTNNIITYTTAEGLVTNNIKSLLIDGEIMWVGTSSDIMRMDLGAFHSEGRFEVKTYSISNIFRGIECNRNAATVGSDGRVWFGTVNGLVGLDPAKENKNMEAPSVYIRNIEVYYESEGWKHYSRGIEVKTGLPVGLTLPHNLNKVTISFGAVSFSAPDQVYFSYKLEGREDKWSKLEHDRKVTYSALEPGSYTFRLKAVNESGIWSSKEAIWKFEITPPYWSTWWFYTIVILGSGLLIAGFIFWRIKKVQREKSKLEQLILQRTAELLEQRDELEKKNQEKEVLLKEVHHRVKNNLQVIISLLSLQTQKIFDKETIKALKDAQNRVQSMALVHKRLYQSNDFAHVDFKSYMEQLCDTIKDSYGPNKDIKHVIECDDDVAVDVETAIPLGLIVNEIVTNSYKYAFADGKPGEVHLTLTRSDDGRLVFKCWDTGEGFDKAVDLDESETLGLQLVDALAEQLEGEFKAFGDGPGAKFELWFG